MKKQEIFTFVDDHREEMLALWEDFVNAESGCGDKESIDQIQENIKGLLEKEGASVRSIEYAKAGNMLIADIGEERKQKPVIFMGHIDTVFKKGTTGKRPFRIEEGKAYGPGVLDMKGGVVAFLYAMKALNAVGFTERPIKILLAGDEENGHLHSNASEIFMEESTCAVAAFNCETGFIDDALVVGRKGVANFTMEVRGRSAHVGNDPENGRSAILEMAYKVIAIEKLTNLQEGISFNVGLIEGGTVANATPDYGKIVIDVRFSKEEALVNITKHLEEIAGKIYVPDTITTLTKGITFKPMKATEGVRRLFSLVKETAIENNFGIPYEKQVGGGSDSAYTVMAGVPTLCAMGVKGGRNHSPEEYAVVETLFERAKLLAACVLKLSHF